MVLNENLQSAPHNSASERSVWYRYYIKKSLHYKVKLQIKLLKVMQRLVINCRTIEWRQFLVHSWTVLWFSSCAQSFIATIKVKEPNMSPHGKTFLKALLVYLFSADNNKWVFAGLLWWINKCHWIVEYSKIYTTL